MKNLKNLKPLLKSASFYRRFAMAILLILVFIRPTISTSLTDREMTNLNIWFVADATGSMVAKDADNGASRRFEKVSEDLTTIVSKIHGAKYSLIAQDTATYTASPLTTNADAIISAKAYLKPKDSLMSKPTNLTELLEYTKTRIAKHKERYPERNNVVIIMSDGEDVSGSNIKIPNELSSMLDASIVLGYGSTTGSLIEKIGSSFDIQYDNVSIKEGEYVTYFGDDSSITVDSSHNVISKINESNLNQIASALGSEYYHRESGEIPGSAINKLASASSATVSQQGDAVSSGSEIYWIFALILVFLLLWEGEEVLNRILSERRSSRA